jgi:glycosyltransferase involved in cell wall biosynthesis/aminoglycoside phosphotransferase (APT) family kinase protein
MSKVSVIITTHNQARFVTQAVESVLAQTFRDFEIIVIDDGSTDNTPESLAGYLDSITYIRQSQGIMAAWVTGMHTAEGAFLSFMHADDLMPPQKLEWQVQQLEAQPELGLVYFAGQIRDGEATQIIRGVESSGQGHLDGTLVTLNLFLSDCPLIRRDCVERAGLLEAHLGQDSDWNPWEQITLAGYEIDPIEQLFFCKEHLTIFLQKLYGGDIRTAQRHMIEAVRVYPLILKEPQVFIDSVFDYAKSPDVNDPVTFAQAVLENLPDCAQDLERFRGRILAELYISRAFQSYRMGNMSQVRRNMIVGLRYDPFFLKNRGVISIFCRSLLNRNDKFEFADHGSTESDILRSVIKNVQEALDQSVDSVERTSGGTFRNTYLVKSGGRSFILHLGDEQSDTLTLSQVIAVTERARAVGVPVPSILAHNLPASDVPGPAWSVEEWMPGHYFIPRNMVWRDALSISAKLGQCLRRLHSIETRGFGILSSTRLDALYQTYGQWLDSRILENCRSVARVSSEVIPLIEGACQFLHRSYYKEAPKLCHGDLVPWNLLVNTGHLSAVIDWNGAQGCDPAFDVATLHFWIDDEQILTTLLQAYAPAEPEVFRHRVIAAVICYAAALLSWDFSKQTINRDEVYRLCSRWLTDNRIVSSFRLAW